MDGGHQGLDVLRQHLAGLTEQPEAELVPRTCCVRYPLAEPREVGLGELLVGMREERVSKIKSPLVSVRDGRLVRILEQRNSGRWHTCPGHQSAL